MDNLTHTLTGIAISHTGLNRKTRFATLSLILAANAPDIDILARLKSSLAYLQYHRGISHSLLGIVVLALLVAGLVYGLGKRSPRGSGPPVDGRWLLLSALLGTGSHLLLDFTNAYGVRPFLPFSGRWYAWDIVPIIDPLLLVIFVLGLGMPWLLRVASEEIGARRSRSAAGAVFCLGAMVVLWSIRDFAHGRALNILNSRTYSGEAAGRLGAFPVAVNPFAWSGVAETVSAFHLARVNALNPNLPPDELATFQKPQASPVLSTAMQTPGAKVVLNFDRFPWAQVCAQGPGFTVSFSDLRFYNPTSKTRAFTLQMQLDQNLKLRQERFYFAGIMTTFPRGAENTP